MSYKFNPFTGTLDDVGPNNGNGVPGGSNTQVQFNDGGVFGGDVDLTWNKTSNLLTVGGDINLNDGGSFTTTLQTITPTANRTVSLPNATGTVALVAGSSGQITYNNAGANAGVSSFTADSSGRLTNSASSASGFPVKLWNGTIFAGTTPHVLVQPSTASAGSWSASGTALGVNTAAGFAGRLIDCQVNGSALFNVDNSVTSETRIFTSLVSIAGNIRQTGGGFSISGNSVGVRDTGTFEFWSGVAASPSVVDLRLFRDAAGILAQRNGTAAQTYRVYNTYTSSTNYELGKLEWNTNVFRIGTEKGSGGGTARALEFQTDGTTRATVDTSGRLLVGTSTARSNFFNTTLSSIVQTEGANASDSNLSRFTSQVFGTAGTAGPIYILAKHRSNSVGDNTIVQSGDQLGVLSFQGSDGTEFVEGANIIAQVDGTPGANDMPGRLVFSTTADGAASPTERMRIDSTGLVTLAGPGIKFPATQVASADPNTLDDYEEGTFTPTVIGLTTAGTATYTIQTGRYTKTGNVVTFLIYVNYSGGTGSGDLRLSGLPFTVGGGVNTASVAFGLYDQISVAANNTLSGYTVSGASAIAITNLPVGNVGAASNQAYDAAGVLMCAGSYFTT